MLGFDSHPPRNFWLHNMDLRENVLKIVIDVPHIAGGACKKNIRGNRPELEIDVRAKPGCGDVAGKACGKNRGNVPARRDTTDRKMGLLGAKRIGRPMICSVLSLFLDRSPKLLSRYLTQAH